MHTHSLLLFFLNHLRSNCRYNHPSICLCLFLKNKDTFLYNHNYPNRKSILTQYYYPIGMLHSHTSKIFHHRAFSSYLLVLDPNWDNMFHFIIILGDFLQSQQLLCIFLCFMIFAVLEYRLLIPPDLAHLNSQDILKNCGYLSTSHQRACNAQLLPHCCCQTWSFFKIGVCPFSLP